MDKGEGEMLRLADMRCSEVSGAIRPVVMSVDEKLLETARWEAEQSMGPAGWWGGANAFS